MLINIKLWPNSKKNLNDTIYDIIDIIPNKTDVEKFGIKAGYWTAGIFGDGGTNTVFSWVSDIFKNLIENIMKNNHIYADIQKVTVEKDHEMLNVTATARSIEYSKSLAENYNRIMDGLKQLPADHIVRKILDTLQDDKIAVVSALLDAISEKKKEAIIKLLIGEFHESLCAFLTKLLNDNKIELAIKKISFD